MLTVKFRDKRDRGHAGFSAYGAFQVTLPL